jgi:hypothetical protein
MHPRSLSEELRIASIEPRISSNSSSTSLGQLFASFIRIELRSIGRKVLDAQAEMPAKNLFDRLSLVRGGVVEQNNDRPAQMAMVCWKGISQAGHRSCQRSNNNSWGIFDSGPVAYGLDSASGPLP